MYICEQEHFTNYLEACDYLSKVGNGSVRQSIAYFLKNVLIMIMIYLLIMY